MSATSINDTLLLNLRADHASWPSLLAYSPTDTSDPGTDAHLHNRYVALLALHAHHQPTPLPEDEALITYITDEEILYHQRSDNYRSALSLCAYLLARYRNPQHIWAIWTARESNYDALKSVDSHYMYYAAGGMQAAKAYVDGAGEADIVAGAREGGGRLRWWGMVVEEDYEGDGAAAAEGVKKQVIERIAHDEKYGVTDEKVVAFVESSWRSETSRWAESLVPEEFDD